MGGQTAGRDAAEVSRPDRAWIGWVTFVLVMLYLTWYLLYAAYLAVFSGEGALPPTWRDPDVPVGAEVVSVGEDLCGSGGCARRISIIPAEGESAGELAREMGLRAGVEETYGWRPTNPASVVVYLPNGYGDGDVLTVAVRYKSPFGY
ncbi:hypothetical protein [uncultured Nocardioides sp.]|uniref:hypothetical protein n=1 Tax=uncultured Nocardioides sp. TaxID=198441 RepID=UPI0026042459|nr:hypothetical protein [uncultured Nocardioides sp.]